jgi:uncharacterized membrane protein
MLRKTLIILFGAFPATLLAVLAVYLAAVGLILIAEGNLAVGALDVALGIGALIGTGALWMSVFRPPSRAINFGLVAGLLTITPLLLSLISSEDLNQSELLFWSVLIGGPVIVACQALARDFWKSYVRKPGDRT